MSQPERPEIGSTAGANGIKTNYLETGEGDPVVLIHGSGPGVTAYANWRLVLPALGERFRAIALRIAAQHPERVDKVVLMGCMGVPFEITPGLSRVWGCEPSFQNMRMVLDVFAYSRELATTSWPRCVTAAASSRASRSRSRRCSPRTSRAPGSPGWTR